MKGFDVNFEGIDMNPDQVQAILKKYKKVKKYQRSNIFEVKKMDGTEDYVSELIREGEEYGPLD
jgi:cytochrome oxidase Cu insertion factor (SCO1/SenC/PrrC family)|tara:strand:- start:92 stop:283 length:192 start_codon:yes stop_codon:yes gene_type:complete